MEWGGVGAYVRLRDWEPALCQSVVKFAEQLAEKHNLEPAVAVDVKQALCQFTLDMASRRATRLILETRNAS